ncbi:MAG: molybdenum cofactor biosynthesis protein MoaE, partial [Paracoccaceae bacterium]|nr:molybdenum cofactor biosynthesis protein MoaE [Paracoccaceae bacterium]
MGVIRQKSDFDVGDQINAFSQNHTKMGAIATFTGIVRDNDNETLKAMEIEHYPGMAEKAISEIVQTAMKRWSLGDALVIHRHGTLEPGEVIMMVATAAIHRKDAFEAAEFLMD